MSISAAPPPDAGYFAAFDGRALRRAPSGLAGSARPGDYAELKRQIVAAGLMRGQPAYYLYKFVTVGVLFTLSAVVLLQGAQLPWWIHLGNAVLAALVFGQVGLLGHDLAHMQVSRSQKVATGLGLLLGNLLLGVGLGWWRDSHGAHHSNPNHMDNDPNIDFPVLAFTPDQARQEGRKLWIIRHQTKFIPLLASLQLFSLHWQSVQFVKTWRKRRPLYCAVEGVLLSIHFVAYLAAIFLMLGPWLGATFVILHRGLAGLYLASIFAPNHKGMPLVYGQGAPDFLTEQVLTARNVVGRSFVDFWYGGLNYQIEHHLFPSMPRNNLRKAAAIVRQFCESRGLDYHQTSVGGSFREMFTHFQRVSDALNADRPIVPAPVLGDKSDAAIES